jgi:hypothetical protein
MILERFWQVQEELRQAPSTMASAAIAPVHQYRNIARKEGARLVGPAAKASSSWDWITFGNREANRAASP